MVEFAIGTRVRINVPGDRNLTLWHGLEAIVVANGSRHGTDRNVMIELINAERPDQDQYDEGLSPQFYWQCSRLVEIPPDLTDRGEVEAWLSSP